jgi:hypothetical protein
MDHSTCSRLEIQDQPNRPIARGETPEPEKDHTRSVCPWWTCQESHKSEGAGDPNRRLDGRKEVPKLDLKKCALAVHER